ncbi:MAG TPA: SigE family RNA polymerase sigma factor [Jatrophihabitantaceae bacterium]
MTLDGLGPDFDDFVRSASTSLLRLAYLLTGDHGHAEDLVQTALLRTARRWPSAQAQPEAFARRVLTNLAKDRWRSRSRRPVETAPGPEPGHDDPNGQVLLRRTLLPAVLRLPARQRAVLVLRYFEDLSIDETATVLGCSAGTVKSQTHAALARLRDLLGDVIPTAKEIDHAH